MREKTLVFFHPLAIKAFGWTFFALGLSVVCNAQNQDGLGPARNLDMKNLRQVKVAILVTDGFEESELTVPTKTLKDVGATVHIISPKGGKIQAFRHFDKSIQIASDRKLDEVQASEYDAVVLPGGALNADALRTVPLAQRFVQDINKAEKPIAVICHGSWLLVSANLVKGRTLTSWLSIADDIRNAGGQWLDKEVVVEKNLISSRKPADLPAFCRAILELFSTIDATRRTAA